MIPQSSSRRPNRAVVRTLLVCGAILGVVVLTILSNIGQAANEVLDIPALPDVPITGVIQEVSPSHLVLVDPLSAREYQLTLLPTTTVRIWDESSRTFLESSVTELTNDQYVIVSLVSTVDQTRVLGLTVLPTTSATSQETP